MFVKKVREFYFGPKVREKSGFVFFKMLNCHEHLLLFLSIIENMKVHNRHVNLQDFFVLFTSLCYIISIKLKTDIIWNELFQTSNVICLICLHTI